MQKLEQLEFKLAKLTDEVEKLAETSEEIRSKQNIKIEKLVGEALTKLEAIYDATGRNRDELFKRMVNVETKLYTEQVTSGEELKKSVSEITAKVDDLTGMTAGKCGSIYEKIGMAQKEVLTGQEKRTAGLSGMLSRLAEMLSDLADKIAGSSQSSQKRGEELRDGINESLNGFGRRLLSEQAKRDQELSGMVTSVSEKIDVLSKSDETHTSQLRGNIVEGINSLGKSMTAQFADLSKRDAEFSSSVAVVSGKIDALSQTSDKNTAQLRAGMNEGLNDLGGSIVSRLAEQTKHTQEIITAVAAVSGKADELTKVSDSRAAQLRAGMNEGLNSLGSRMLSELTGISAEQARQREELSGVLSDVSDKVTVVLGRSDEFLKVSEARTEQLRELSAAVQSGQDKHQAIMEQMMAGIAGRMDELSEMSERQSEEFEEKLGKAETSILFGQTKHTGELSQKTDELADMVKVLSESTGRQCEELIEKLGISETGILFGQTKHHDEIAKQLTGLTEKLDGISSDMSEKSGKIRGITDTINTNVESMHENVALRISDIEKSITDVAGRVDGNAQAFGEFVGSVRDKAAQIEEEYRSTIAQQKEYCEKLRELVESVLDSQAYTADELGALEKLARDIGQTCDKTQQYMASSEQLLRMIALTDIMNELPEQ